MMYIYADIMSLCAAEVKVTVHQIIKVLVTRTNAETISRYFRNHIQIPINKGYMQHNRF